MTSAYEVLGLQTTATETEIRAAYKRKAAEAHPDRHGGSDQAHEFFLEIQAAYQILSDPVRRQAHDVDPEAQLDETILELRHQQLSRRRMRLRRLYE